MWHTRPHTWRKTVYPLSHGITKLSAMPPPLSSQHIYHTTMLSHTVLESAAKDWSPCRGDYQTAKPSTPQSREKEQGVSCCCPQPDAASTILTLLLFESQLYGCSLQERQQRILRVKQIPNAPVVLGNPLLSVFALVQRSGLHSQQDGQERVGPHHDRQPEDPGLLQRICDCTNVVGQQQARTCNAGLTPSKTW